MNRWYWLRLLLLRCILAFGLGLPGLVLRCSGRSLIGYYLVLSSCCLSPLVGCLVPVLARLSLRRTRSILLGVGFRLVVSGISLGFPSLVL